MNVKPMLDSWEVPNIAAIESLERRALIELPVPGLAGSLFQDTNSEPARIAIRGSLYGDQARDDFLGQVRAKFQAGQPLTFVGDIVTATQLQYVLVETLHFDERGTEPDETGFTIVLRESPPPPPAGANPLADIDAGLLDEAAGFVAGVGGALDLIDGAGSIPDLSDPTPPLKSALDPVTAAAAGLGGLASGLTGLFEKKS